jgi:stress-induced morphogen
MTMQSRIEDNLRRSLEPTHLEVVDESHMHSVPDGSATHFKVVVVSPRFEGLTQVKRHQLVYAALAAEMAEEGGIHALAITSRSPAEWAARPEANESPLCHGGSKVQNAR